MFKIGEKLDAIRLEVSRLVEAVMYLIKLLQHTNRVLDPNDSKNPYKLRKNRVIQGDFGLDPTDMWKKRGRNVRKTTKSL
tara:strand:+ start:210 stop:449 length:240 start_codon:yes stop_codon:yes gene_type:complete